MEEELEKVPEEERNSFKRLVKQIGHAIGGGRPKTEDGRQETGDGRRSTCCLYPPALH